jgi:hypothetical protein
VVIGTECNLLKLRAITFRQRKPPSGRGNLLRAEGTSFGQREPPSGRGNREPSSSRGDLGRLLAFLFMPFDLLNSIHFKLFWFSNLLIMRASDEGYSRRQDTIIVIASS